MTRAVGDLPSDARATITARLEDAPIDLGLVFGSHATGRATAGSDIDIAVAYTDDADVADAHLSLVADLTRLREMLADLEAYLDGPREKQGVSKHAFERDRDLQDIVERRLEKATQTAIDIGRRVGRIEGQDLEERTNAGVFVALVELEILPESHRQAFADIGGLRNVLAHRYRHVDTEQIHETYHDLERLERFSEAIYQYLQTQ